MKKQQPATPAKPFNPAEWVKSLERLGDKVSLVNGSQQFSYGRLETLTPEQRTERTNLYIFLNTHEGCREQVQEYLEANVDTYGYGPSPLGNEPIDGLEHLETGMKDGERFYKLTIADDTLAPRHLKGETLTFWPYRPATIGKRNDVVVVLTSGEILICRLVKYEKGIIIVSSFGPKVRYRTILTADLLRWPATVTNSSF